MASSNEGASQLAGAGDDAQRVLWDLAMDAGGIGTFDWDLASGRLLWDDRLIALFGYDAQSFDGSIDAFTARLHPDDVERVTGQLDHAIRTVGVFDSEYRLVVPDAATRWVGARGRVLADPAGRPVRLLGAAYDITERRTGESRVTSLLEAMASAFFALDTDWRFTYANNEAARLLGRSREDMVGGNIWQLFPAAVGSAFETNYRHVMTSGEPAMFDAYYPDPLDAWYEVRAWRTDDGVAVSFLDVTARRSLERDAARSGARADLLGKITEQLIATLDHASAAERLAGLVVPAVADWCVVNLVDDHEHVGARHALTSIAANHHDPLLQPAVESYGRVWLTELNDRRVVDAALGAGHAQHLRHDASQQISAMFAAGRARDLLTTLAPGTVLVLPLNGPNGPVGLLTLANGTERGEFTDEDVRTAEHVAARAGLVLDNARLYRQQRDVAAGLQRSLLTAPAEPDHVQVVVRYLPAAEAAAVGGDWYDAFLQRDGAMVVAVGDVTGHNIEAAAVMAQLRSLLRGVAVYSGAAPAELLRGVDEAMTTLQIGTTATAVVARLEQDADERDRGATRVRWSNAGHPPPMAVDPDGTVTPLVTLRADLMLGVATDTTRRDTELVLDRGATLLLYTDGLVERRDEDIDRGLERLRATLRRLAPHDLDLDTLCDRVLQEMLPAAPDDDVAVVAIRLHGSDRPRPPGAGPHRVPPQRQHDDPSS